MRRFILEFWPVHSPYSLFFCGDSWSNDHPTGSQEALGRHQVVARQPKVFNNQVRMEIVAISQSRPARPGYMYSTIQDTVFHPGFIPFFPKVLSNDCRDIHHFHLGIFIGKVTDLDRTKWGMPSFSRIPLTSKHHWVVATQICFMFTSIWGRWTHFDYIIFFKGVETTN